MSSQPETEEDTLELSGKEITCVSNTEHAYEEITGLTDEQTQMTNSTSQVLHINDSRARYKDIEIDGDHLSYACKENIKWTLYIAANPLSVEKPYFEIDIVDTGQYGAIGIGLVPYEYPLDKFPGQLCSSVGYRANHGKIHEGSGSGRNIGPICRIGDRLGCGINYKPTGFNKSQCLEDIQIVFTRNKSEICTVNVPGTTTPLHPAVAMFSIGEEVQLNLSADWQSSIDKSTFRSAQWNGGKVSWHTTLIDAIDDDDVQTVHRLLEEGFPRHTKKSKGATELHLHEATRIAHKRCVDFLLRKGAYANISDAHGWLPLHYAARNGDRECLESLCRFTADINAQDQAGWTALIFAANVDAPDCVRYILEHGGSVNISNKEGDTTLHRAALKGSIDCVKILLEYGADIESRDNTGYTPLHLSANQCHLDCVQHLIIHGADVNCREENDWQPIHLAAEGGYVDCIKILIEHSADMNSRTKNGTTPLHLSADKGHVDCMQYLITHGSDVNCSRGRKCRIGSNMRHMTAAAQTQQAIPRNWSVRSLNAGRQSSGKMTGTSLPLPLPGW